MRRLALPALAAFAVSVLSAQLRPDLVVRISGRITDQAGGSIPNAKVELVALANNEVSGTQTDQSGRFEVAALPNMAYKLLFKVPGFDLRTIPVSATGRDVELGTITLYVATIVDPVVIVCPGPFFPSGASGSLPGVRLIPDEEGPRLTGAVERNFNSPVPGATIRLVSSGAAFSVRASRRGEFQFERVPPGQYSLIASAPEFADFVMDAIEVKPKSRTEILDPLVLHGCPAGVHCPPTKNVVREGACFVQ